MKRTLVSLLAAIALFGAFVQTVEARGAGDRADTVLRVGATPVPHAELLSLIRDDLAAKGVTLRIVEFTDFITPNMALMYGDIDANFFQHLPFLQTNDEWNARLVSVFGVHVEPFGLYSRRFNNIDDLPQGATIAIPNDPTNGGRALLLLQARGLITLRDGAGLLATPATSPTIPGASSSTNLRPHSFPGLSMTWMPRRSTATSRFRPA